MKASVYGKTCLVKHVVFYLISSKRLIHTLLLPQGNFRILAKANVSSPKFIHAFLNQQRPPFSVDTKVIVMTVLVMNTWAWLRFGHEGFQRGRKWKGGGNKANPHDLFAQQCRQHSTENNRGDTFFFYNRVLSHDPAKHYSDPDVSSIFPCIFP